MFPDVRLRVSRLELGPPVGYPVQFRIVGPDPSELRHIAGAVEAAMRTNPHVRNISDNWGNPSKMVDVQVDQDKARLLGLSSEDIATTLQTLFYTNRRQAAHRLDDWLKQMDQAQ